MKSRTLVYTALLLLAAAPWALAQANAPELAGPLRLDPKALDVALVSQELLTFDVLVAGAEQAAQKDADASRQLAHNGLHVAERPMGFSATDAQLLWQRVGQLGRDDRQGALALFVRSDVVTTEAHALLLEMLGPPPSFAPHAPPAGLSSRQLAWVNLAPQLSQLMGRAWRKADVASLTQQLGPTLAALQPSRAEMLGHEQILDQTFGHKAQAQEQVQVIVVPLMAKDTGATLMLGRAGAITLVGPAANRLERDTLVIHEMLHPRIAALIAANPLLRQAIDQAACLRQALNAADGNRAVSQVYGRWSDYLAESWVRGLSHSLTHSQEGDDGFALARVLGGLGGERSGAQALASRTATTLQQLTARMCHPAS